MNESDLEALVAAAREARRQAYAPYSGFPVGAAVLAGGRTFTGVNVENASFPVGVCAECSAVSAMAVAGERRIDAVAVVAASDHGPTPPCGGCRQILREFAGSDVPIVSVHADDDAILARWTMGELLPAAFER